MNCNLTAADISIEATIPESLPISLQWSDPVFATPQEVAVSVTYFDSYLPAGSQVTLVFLTPEQVTSVFGISIEISSVSGLLFPKGSLPPVSTSVQSLPVTQQTEAISTGVATSAFAASLVVSSPFSFLSTFNQFQLITYLPLSGLPLTGNFSGAIAALNAVNMLPNSLVSLLTVTAESQTPSDQEEHYGLETTLIFPNLVSVITISACVLLSYVPIFILSKVPHRRTARFFSHSLAFFKWTVPLSVCFAVYLDVAVFSLLQVTHSHSEWSYVGTNSAVGYGMLALVGLFPCAIALFFATHSNKLVYCNNPSLKSRWSFFFRDFAPIRKWAGITHFSLFLFRRLLLSTTIFLMRSYPKPFALLNCTSSALIFFYMLILRPYQNTLENTETLLVECGTMVIYLIAGLFAFDWGDSFISVLDQVGTWAVRTVLGLSVALSMIRVANTVICVIKDYKVKLSSQKIFSNSIVHAPLESHSELRSHPTLVVLAN